MSPLKLFRLSWQPFVDANHVIQQFFLPRSYAVTIPIVAGVTVLLALGKLWRYMEERSWSICGHRVAKTSLWFWKPLIESHGFGISGPLKIIIIFSDQVINSFSLHRQGRSLSWKYYYYFYQIHIHTMKENTKCSRFD